MGPHALAVGLLFILINSFYAQEKPFRIRLNENGQFIDTFGRIRLFHGFNSVMKSFPWYDEQILNITRLKLFKEWGFNVVRLGTMWSGAQPTENAFNETYVDLMRKIVKQLGMYGIYSILDMHQDVLSSKCGGYDGAPLWLINKLPDPPAEYKFPYPLNANKTYLWADYYFTYAASDAFQNLYSNEIALSNWERFWTRIATNFSKELSVIGYELINEPWVGNFYTVKERLLPGYAGRTNLLPVYDRLVKGIRRVDNETLIFYEPVTYAVYAPSTGDFGTGFDRVPGGDEFQINSVLSYHYYCFILNSNQYENYPMWKRVVCEYFSGRLFESVLQDVKKTGGGAFLTEFGLCEQDGNPDSINTIECDRVLELVEKYHQSFTYWDSQFFDSNGNPKPTVVKAFARTYPRALQGKPLVHSFNRTSGSFSLSFSIDLSIGAPTEIFIPKTVHYPNGFSNVTVPQMITSYDESEHIFRVFPTSDIKQGTDILVKIEAI